MLWVVGGRERARQTDTQRARLSESGKRDNDRKRDALCKVCNESLIPQYPATAHRLTHNK